MQAQIRILEDLSLNAHPALNTMHLDGWALRFSGGYTARANSVNILCESQLPFSEKIAYCEELYRQHNLPPTFKITPLSPALDTVLNELGYDIVTPTNLMTMEIPSTGASGTISRTEHGVNEHWQSHYFRLNQVNDTDIPLAKAIQNRIAPKTICATVSCRGEVAACGLCVVERDYAGLYDIVVSPQYRRKGYARDICTTLMSEAARSGARLAYLQVVANNSKAINLYKQLGFTDLYRYWYRVKIRSSCV